MPKGLSVWASDAHADMSSESDMDEDAVLADPLRSQHMPERHVSFHNTARQPSTVAAPKIAIGFHKHMPDNLK